MSVGADVPERLPGVRRIPDVFPGCGPLAGIHATLLATEKEALFYVPCDLPYFCAELPQSLLEHMPLHAEAFVCRDSTGRIHPLCGIYRKSVLPLLESELKSGLYSVMRFLQKLEYCCLDTAQLLPDSVFLNMNTPDTYRKVCEE